jgi:hypothetical protein
MAIRRTPINACVIRIVSTDSRKREVARSSHPRRSVPLFCVRLIGSKAPESVGGAARRERAFFWSFSVGRAKEGPHCCFSYRPLLQDCNDPSMHCNAARVVTRCAPLRRSQRRLVFTSSTISSPRPLRIARSM